MLGIVAGKMADEFQKPCFVLTNTNGVCKGSGRSAGDVDLISSMQKIGHLMQRYGGHVGAVGLELKDYNLESFIKSFKPISHNIEKKENVLGILNSHLINYELFSCITSFEPFGNGNPLPKFLCEMEILECRKPGKAFVNFTLNGQKIAVLKACFLIKNMRIITLLSVLYYVLVQQSPDSQSFYTTQNRQIMLIIDRVYTE